MGVYRKGHEVTGIHRYGNTTSEVWKYINGAWRMVWQAIRSCFGRGFWTNKMPWRNADGWKNM
jgi:hypothetical protein